jgi:multidrug efflux pump subunit AcrA (membrane-fusion protein)
MEDVTMSGKNNRIVFVTLLLAVQICLVRQSAAETVTVDAVLLQQLQDAIQQQQQQLQEQSEILESLQQQVIDLKQRAAEAQAEARQAKSAAQQAVDTTERARTATQASSDKVVTSGQERVKLDISGLVNRAVNVADDGMSTKAYFVDNDASNTRFRLVGTGKVTDDLTIGSRLEVALTSNESSEVSQDDETPGNFGDVRWAEVSFDSKRFGKLSLGKGDTASNNSAEVDLSRTNVVQYASVAAIAGGLQFRDNDDNLTGVKVSNAFNNLDGLSRQDRVRYDTPTFHGFHLTDFRV